MHITFSDKKIAYHLILRASFIYKIQHHLINSDVQFFVINDLNMLKSDSINFKYYIKLSNRV